METELDLDESVTILKPFGVSLNIDLDQQYVNELEEQANEQEADNFEIINDLPLQNFEDFISEPITETNNVVPFIEVNGSRVHKSNLVNCELNRTTKISTNRIFRVRNRNDPTMCEETDDENQIYVTDTILSVVKIKDKAPVIVILIIDKIKHNNTFITSIDPTLIQECELRGSILKLILNDNNQSLFWSGDYLDLINVHGELCLPFVVDEFNSDASQSFFSFETAVINRHKEFLTTVILNTSNKIPVVPNPYCQNVFQLLKIDLPSNQLVSDNDKIMCKFCEKYVLLQRLRCHIAKHIIKKEIKKHAHLCGFCGSIGCSLELIVTSGKGKQKNYGPKSDCKYFRSFSLKCAEKTSGSCTNRPIHCPICNNLYWSYNLESHYESCHSRFLKDLPKQISDEEALSLLKSNY